MAPAGREVVVQADLIGKPHPEFSRALCGAVIGAH